MVGARQATDDNIIRRMRFAWWITKAIDAQWQYVIVFFPRQQWLRERASLLPSYVHCLSCLLKYVLHILTTVL
jgi:hypothetical protein